MGEYIALIRTVSHLFCCCVDDVAVDGADIVVLSLLENRFIDFSDDKKSGL